MTYEQILKEFDKKFKCIQSDCDGYGNIPHQVGDNEWEAVQCQFHAEYLFPIKSFFKQSFIKYLQSDVEQAEKNLQAIKDIQNDFARGMIFEISGQIAHLQAQIKELGTN